MKCGYCCKEGTDVRECSCDHASLYRQLKLTGGARKNPPARLAVLANAAGIPHHITSPSTCLMQQAVEQSTGEVPTAVTFAQLRLAGLVGKTGPEPRAVLIDIANELARAMMKTTDITSEATHAVALRHDGAVAKSGGDRERCSMYAKAIVSYHQMVSNTIDQAMDALLEPGMSGAAGAADGITTDTQPMDARAAATVSEGMPLVAAAPGPVSTVVSTLNDPVEAETVDDGVMASWSAQDIVGSAAAATISVVTRDAGPSERVVVEAPMANPTLGVLEQAIAKEVAESGETLDLSETLWTAGARGAARQNFLCYLRRTSHRDRVLRNAERDAHSCAFEVERSRGSRRACCTGRSASTSARRQASKPGGRAVSWLSWGLLERVCAGLLVVLAGPTGEAASGPTPLCLSGYANYVL